MQHFTGILYGFYRPVSTVSFTADSAKAEKHLAGIDYSK